MQLVFTCCNTYRYYTLRTTHLKPPNNSSLQLPKAEKITESKTLDSPSQTCDINLSGLKFTHIKKQL